VLGVETIFMIVISLSEVFPARPARGHEVALWRTSYACWPIGDSVISDR
jgi:hypothetical protein